jgi:predicted outer membrane lipoprotein
MQTLLLSCAFGAVCTMVLCVVSAAAVKRDQLVRRGIKLFPPEEI